MGLSKLLGFSILFVVGAIVFQFYYLQKPVPVPNLDFNKNWGDNTKDQLNSGVQPFKVNFGSSVIEELRKELNRTRPLTPPLQGVGFRYGFNSETTEKVIKYWRDTYLPKWNERQQYLNKFPQFKLKIQGLDIHYIHVKGDHKAGKEIVPLILIHGWPGSVREFYEVIPNLVKATKNKKYDFDIVVPSLPGYGWSEATHKTGLSSTEMSIIFRNLMLKIGYNNFVVQGGDWGSIIGSSMATLFPDNVMGYHSNLCALVTSPVGLIKNVIASFMPTKFVEPQYIDFHFPLGKKFLFSLEESGYMHFQATKPDTIGNALIGNPVGLSTYILEKFSTWTKAEYRSRNDGGLTEQFTMDALLDNIMIYYLSNMITTSMRLYAEHFCIKNAELKLERVPTNVPVGCARYKEDLLHELDWILEDKFKNIIHSKYYMNGGHFAAMELPDQFSNDFIMYMDTLWNKLNSNM